MKIINSIQEITEISRALRLDNKTIGFVPTMGALHKGHLTLMQRAKDENDILIVSVFVNPIQFNNPEDLEKYPRDIDADSNKLESIGCDYLFYPKAEEVYAQEPTEEFDFGNLDKVMEGEQRPGHFRGVAIIVSRLFNWINPNKAYFGEKDFQQLTIIKAMVNNLDLGVEIVACPIVREEDGLAMSSRNQRLSASAREIAPRINAILRKSYSLSENISISQIKSFVINEFKLVKDFELEYFEIVDAKTLEPITQRTENGVVGCVALWLDGVRLIDVIRYY
ncbi:MAG: pantoate--beta-alanine ligase [Bacteroidales bacterium]|jgi:pantoate--beta-alanine ligase|nr:pantoate--beta-alanine ligase [Bacteroidales bacterium]